MSAVLSIGEVAALLSERHGCRVDGWHIRSAIKRGFLKEPARFGISRIFVQGDLPRVEKALVKAGYIGEKAEVPA